MKSQNVSIAADQQVVGDVGRKITSWIDEVSMLQDIANNCERTGVQPEASNVTRARALVDELEGWRRKLAEQPRSSDTKATCEWRINRVIVDAICREAHDAAHALGLPNGESSAG
jgi:hypothetical protein